MIFLRTVSNYPYRHATQCSKSSKVASYEICNTYKLSSVNVSCIFKNRIIITSNMLKIINEMQTNLYIHGFFSQTFCATASLLITLEKISTFYAHRISKLNDEQRKTAGPKHQLAISQLSGQPRIFVTCYRYDESVYKCAKMYSKAFQISLLQKS